MLIFSPPKTKSSGFSIVETMVVMGMVGTLLATGAPALSKVIRDNGLLSDVFALRATLNSARSEALAQRSFVTVCASNDGTSCSGSWNEGYIAFTDFDGDGVLDPDGPRGDQIIQASGEELAALSADYSNIADRVRFSSQGSALNFSGSMTMCDDRGSHYARGIFVSNVGTVQALVDSDKPANGIVNVPGGGDVSC
jgi:type IV fimbrial biogenesis protein FimT